MGPAPSLTKGGKAHRLNMGKVMEEKDHGIARKKQKDGPKRIPSGSLRGEGAVETSPLSKMAIEKK